MRRRELSEPRSGLVRRAAQEQGVGHPHIVTARAQETLDLDRFLPVGVAVELADDEDALRVFDRLTHPRALPSDGISRSLPMPRCTPRG